MVTAEFQFFDATAHGESKEASVVLDKKASGSKKPIRCRSCDTIITDEAERISIAGQHIHRRSNPFGIEFEFGCFRSAGGCKELGAVTNEYTWFPAYGWQLALCSHCKTHLGWLFSGEDQFYGLILAQLRRDE